MNGRLRILLEDRSLLEHAATDDEVAAMWERRIRGERPVLAATLIDPPWS